MVVGPVASQIEPAAVIGNSETEPQVLIPEPYVNPRRAGVANRVVNGLLADSQQLFLHACGPPAGRGAQGEVESYAAVFSAAPPGFAEHGRQIVLDRIR